MRVFSFAVQDMRTDKYGILASDRSQDYILDDVYGERDGRISFVFHRQYDTCDNDDYLIDVSYNAFTFLVCVTYALRHYCAVQFVCVYYCFYCCNSLYCDFFFFLRIFFLMIIHVAINIHITTNVITNPCTFSFLLLLLLLIILLLLL